MKNIFLIITICLSLISNYSAKAQACPNGGLEWGTFTNFNLFIGTNTTTPTTPFVDVSTFVTNGGTAMSSPGSINRFLVETVGNDPNIGTYILPKVLTGNRSLRLGTHDVTNTPEAEIASYTLTVNSSKTVTFSWAGVFEDPGHTPDENPFFAFWVSRSNTLSTSLNPGSIIASSQTKRVADISNPFFTAVTGTSKIFRTWTTECIDLSEEEELNTGDQVTIYFMTAHCTFNPHFNYVYIDDLCDDVLTPCFSILNNPICNLDDLIVDGSCSQNVPATHNWAFGKLNSNTINDFVFPSIGVGLSDPSFAGPIGVKNLGQFQGVKDVYSQGGPGYYQVDLIFTKCDGTHEIYSKIVYINAPWVKAENVFLCCGESTELFAEVEVTDPTDVGSFEWFDGNGNPITGFIENSIISGGILVGKTTTYTPTTINQSGKYRIVYTTPSGCKGEKTIYLIYVGTLHVTIKPQECWPLPFQYAKPCNKRKLKVFLEHTPCKTSTGTKDNWAYDNYKLWEQMVKDEVGDVSNNVTYLWNTGATTDVIEPSTAGKYYCTVDWLCGTKSDTIDFDPNHYTGTLTFGSGAGQLWAPTAISPNGDGLNDCFRITHTGYPMNTPGAYNAYGYELRIFDQWGMQINNDHTGIPDPCINNSVIDIDVKTCNGFINREIQYCPNSNCLPIDTYYWMLYLTNCDNNGIPQLVGIGSFDVVL